MAFRFESLEVFKKAATLSNRITKIALLFPKHELFNLGTQIRRAADSVVLNTAEGSTGQSKPEFARFLTIALRSGVEVAACLYLAYSRNYVDEKLYQELYSEYELLCRMITSLKQSVAPNKTK